MRSTYRIACYIAAAVWLAVAAILVGCAVIGELEGRRIPPVLPIAAAAVTLAALRFFLWGRHTSPRRK
jgi:hypothetical protein